jgi:hypothetical protein
MTTPSGRYRIRGRGVHHNIDHDESDNTSSSSIGIIPQKKCESNPSNSKIEEYRPKIEALTKELRDLDVYRRASLPTTTNRGQGQVGGAGIKGNVSGGQMRPLPQDTSKKIRITFDTK